LYLEELCIFPTSPSLMTGSIEYVLHTVNINRTQSVTS